MTKPKPRRTSCRRLGRNHARQTGGAFVYLLILLALLGTVGAVYRYYQLHSQDLKSAQSRMSKLSEQVGRAVMASQQQQQKFDQGMQRMSSIETSIAAIPSLDAGRASARLSLSEAEHLLQTAEWQLRLYQDSQSALFALEKAHQRLDPFREHRSLERVALSIRRLISVLKTLQLPDVEGILRDTQRLQNRILLLPPVRKWQDDDLAELFAVTPAQTSGQLKGATAGQNDAQDNTDSQQTWYQRLWSFVVQVRPASLLGHLSLDSHNQTVLWENLLLLVSRVQSATLHGNQSVYLTSLDEITRLVSTAYPGELKQKTAVMQLIEQMRGEVVAVNLPQLSGMRTKLAEAIDKYDQSFDRRSKNNSSQGADSPSSSEADSK